MHWCGRTIYGWQETLGMIEKNQVTPRIWVMRILISFRVMAFIIGLPVIQIILFCLAIGHDPTGLKLAVSNKELDSLQSMQQFCPVTKGCNQTYLSCRYLEYLTKNKSMIVVSYKWIHCFVVIRL